MKVYLAFIVMCLVLENYVEGLSSNEETEITEICCVHAESIAISAASAQECAKADPPDYLAPEELDTCSTAMQGCCDKFFKLKEECLDGLKYAPAKRCNVPKTDTGRTCCEECSFGRWTGESQGKEACGRPATGDVAPNTALRKNAYYQCCLEAASQPTTTEKELETTTEKKIETTTRRREKCQKNSCDHICNDEEGKIRCMCQEGYRLQSDKKTCKDINECAEAVDDLCTTEGTVCHNTAGSFKCVPIKKREAGLSCPPGFKKNVMSQVCDDINECQHPRPPCPKYLCENTIGGYKCAGKPGKPYVEDDAVVTTEAAEVTDTTPRNDICPPGFRAGPDDECLDIDECEERLDDCQRLSQFCINTHGHFFCQDHVSKRCYPGFKVNPETGMCEDINECEDITQVCKRSEVCVNLPGAYNCKSKISTLPKLATKTCQEGTRMRPGGTICEDIDECREGTHLCDEFQNCINTFGGHECRCKNGFELDSSTGSCVDVDECALKLDNCSPGTYCLNMLGTFTCTRRAPVTTSTSTTTIQPIAEYEYYDSEEDESPSYGDTNDALPAPVPVPRPALTPTTALKPTTPRLPTTPKITTQEVTTTSTTRITPKYPSNYLPTRITPTTNRTPYTNRPERPIYTRPTTQSTPRRPYKPDESPRRPEEIPRKPEVSSEQPDDIYRRPNNRPRRPDDRPTKPDDKPRQPEYTPDVRDNTSPYETPNNPDEPTRPEVSPTEPSETSSIEDRPRRPESTRPSYSSRPYSPTRPYDRPSRPTSSTRPSDRPTEHEVPSMPDLPPKPDDAETPPDFDVDNLHCLFGYQRDAYGNCVDVNECETNRHICGSLETCVNRDGGYICECIQGFIRDSTGWCVTITTSSTTPMTTTSTTAISTTESTTTDSTTTVVTTPRWRYTRPRPSYPSSVNCDFGYTHDPNQGKCVDVDECERNQHSCAPNEDCVNISGGYNCVCGRRCRTENDGTPNVYYPVSPTRDTPAPVAPAPVVPSDDSNIITVGAQYGQRGPRQMRPAHSRLNFGTMHPCPWGYKLTPDKRCVDIDECARNVSKCGPQQRCENFFGGYSCQCPSGHKLYRQDSCEDIDECRYGSPCSYNGECINTVGSYRCECGAGFRNAPTNDKVCMDIDECTDTPSVCDHECTNTWGGYRCYCRRGYRLDKDNRTCVDVDECAEWAAVRLRGRLCSGQCVNEPGSYRCSCPAGYSLSDDGKSCLDINECETGEASCAFSKVPGEVCQNTRGGYHCHTIECPKGYRLESKHRCTRIQRSCPISDWSCLQQPSAYSYNFITFVSNIYLPSGRADLFTMHGPAWRDSIVTFELRMVDVKASRGVEPADLRCFDMRPSNNICVISLLCSLSGPQVVELELTMSLYQHDQFAGVAVARLIVIVSQYDF